MAVTIGEFQQGTVAYIFLEAGLLLTVDVLIVLLVLRDVETVYSSVLCITNTISEQ